MLSFQLRGIHSTREACEAGRRIIAYDHATLSAALKSNRRWNNALVSLGLSALPQRVGAAEVAGHIASDVDAVALDVLAQMAAAVEAKRGAPAPPAGVTNVRLRRRLAEAAAHLPPVDSVRAGVLAMRATLVDEDTWLQFTRSGGARRPPAVVHPPGAAPPGAPEAVAPASSHGYSHGGLPCDGHHADQGFADPFVGGSGGPSGSAVPAGTGGRGEAALHGGLHGP